MNIKDIDVTFDFTTDTKGFWDGFGERNDGVISSAAIKVKYDYCPEFREYVNAHKNKYFCEYIYTKPKVKAGVLKVTDENSPFYGKYIGANYTCIAIQLCIDENK